MPLIAITSQSYDKLLEPWIDNLRIEQRQRGAHESQIVVPNHHVAGWLNQSLARHCGISMNLKFRYVDSLAEESSGSGASTRSASPGANALTLAWSALLWEGLRSGAFDGFAHSWGIGSREPTTLQTLQLAWEYARQLERLALHRPQWLVAWARHSDPLHGNTLQAVLQRRLYQYLLEQGAPEPAWLSATLRSPVSTQDTPPNLHCFGFWSFPPSVWAKIESLAHGRSVFLYLPFPTSSYIVDLTRRSLREPQLLEPESDLPLPPKRYQLLSKLGQRARAMQMLLLDHEVQTVERFAEPVSSTTVTRLQWLQNHLTHPDESTDALRLHPVRSDHSLQVHSGCDPRREVEIVKACIQRCLSELPDLALESIQVAAPDLTPYLPAIAEVFAADPPASRLAYHIRRASDAEESPGIRCVIDLLSWLSSDWERTPLLEWLAMEPVRAALEFSLRDLELIDDWTRAAGIHRGNPAHAPSSQGSHHSWESGQRRLLQAYAGELSPDALGFTPFDRDPPHEHRETFFRWAELYEWLRQEAITLRSAPFPLPVHRDLVTRIVHRVLPATSEFEKQVLLGTLNRLVESWPLTAGMDAASFRYLLRKSLPKLPPPQVMHRKAGIAFVSIQPEELTPCRIRILLGMSEKHFPSPNTAHSHDLLSLDETQPSDPSRREDDRYWLLQSLHQTQDQWIVIYQGQDASGAESQRISPSVQSILDALHNSADTASEPGGIPVVQHPRFSFDAACFGPNPLLRHHSAIDFEVASALQSVSDSSGDADGAQRLPSIPPSLEGCLTIWDLARFFRHPNAFVCERHLGMRFPNTYDDTPAHEPLLWMGAGASFSLHNHLMRAQARGLSRDDTFTLLESHAAELPSGIRELGLDLLLQELTGASALAGSAPLRLLEHLELKPVETELLPGHVLRCASLTHRLPPEVFLATVHGSRKSEKSEIEAWVHLLALWMHQSPEERRGFGLLHRDASVWFAPPEDPQGHLRDLMRLYLEFRNQPVPFFPATSYHAFRAPEKRGFLEYSSAWEGEHGEKYDAATEFLFRGNSPFGPTFNRLCEAIIGPLDASKTQNPMKGTRS